VEEIRFVCGSGGLGAGKVLAKALDGAMALNPHFIACDAGTTDSGPFSLGSGRSNYPREGVKLDLEIIMAAGHRADIPVIIGSAGTAGLDTQVDWVVDIAREIATERQFKVRTASIHSEQSPSYLKQLFAEGRIKALDPAPPVDEALFDRTSHVVGMMGVEPLQGALAGGAKLVIAGRSSDSALFAALPILKGFPEGLAWHAGKVMECGTQVCESAGRGVIYACLTRDDLVIRPFGEGLRCTPQSVAAHSFYENGDPYLHVESSGTLDLTNSTYEAVEDTTVRIRGSAFTHSPTYTVKLEGAEPVGFQAVIIGGIRDPYFVRQLDTWLAGVRSKITGGVSEILGLGEPDYRLDFHVYGRNAVMGELEPVTMPAHEVGIVLNVTASTQVMATKIADISRQPLLHHLHSGMEGQHHVLRLHAQSGAIGTWSGLSLLPEPRGRAAHAGRNVSHPLFGPRLRTKS
jgi:hypothetical protein